MSAFLSPDGGMAPGIGGPPQGAEAGMPQSGMNALSQMQGLQDQGGGLAPDMRDPRQAGKMRSAMAFLDSAQELLQAASDNMPTLGPVIARATQIIAEGLQQVMGGGGGAMSPPGVPPISSEMPMPGGMPGEMGGGMSGGMNDSTYGGGIMSDRPTDLPY